ncbi:inturned planar cell polarity protein isoform X2 [Oratosquilla oratoria]|uniref:inturned planar cell polarity protein isoform X2 n=1 Tax=Oratosquilla oratoria TaxID=337810 RepID=UPI003F772B4C
MTLPPLGVKIYDEAEWLEHVASDGSLMYAESYVSSTVREKQVQALRAQSAAAVEKKPPCTSPSKDLKKKNKFMRLLQRRPSVRVKGSSGTSGNEGTLKTGDLPTTSAPKVTFRDNPSGEMRTVKLYVTENGNNLGRRASLCEIVLGIMPGRFNEPPDSRVMVAGLVPGSEALRNGVIKIGDWLKEVNGVSISWSNLDDYIGEIQIPSTITLSVQKCASETLPEEDTNSPKRIIQTNFVRSIAGHEGLKQQDAKTLACLKEIPHTVLHLSLTGVTEDSPDGADIRYQFPKWSNKLVKVRGMFITTAHTVHEVAGQPVLCSTVLLDGDYYHVAYRREGNDIFLVALPHSCLSSHELIVLTEQLSRLLKYEFKSLGEGIGQSKNKAYIDHLMSLVLGAVLWKALENTSNKSAQNAFLPVVPNNSEKFLHSSPAWLILSDIQAKLQLDNCISELESGDFGEEDSDYEDHQSPYIIVGSCFFYKGYVVTSHLNPEDLMDCWLFARHHGLLALTAHEAVSQLVGWHNVFPSSLSRDRQAISEGVRHHILIVAMNHCLLAMLLESGLVSEEVGESEGPDPVMVDQAEATLYQLDTLGISNVCQESISCGIIETVVADSMVGQKMVIKRNKEEKVNEITEGIAGMRLPDVPSILKQKSSPLPESRLHAHDHTGCECEGGSLTETSDDSYSPDSYSPSSRDSSAVLEDEEDDEESHSDWRIYKGQEGRGLTQYDLEINDPSPKPPLKPRRVTCGKENVLLHYIQLEVGEGVLVEPLTGSPHIRATYPPLHEQVIQNFRAVAGRIRHVLQASQRTKETPGGSYTIGSALNTVKEHGVLITCAWTVPDGINKRRNQLTFSYWVVGRLLSHPYPREVYLCYHESVPQNVIELANAISGGCMM